MDKWDKFLTQLSILVVVAIVLYIFTQTYRTEANYVKSNLNNKEYFVQNLDNKENAANLLSIVDNNITIFKTYLSQNADKYPEYKPYIKQFTTRVTHLVLYENKPGSKYTSFTVNKGEEMALCLRSKNGQLHDINLIMYVVLHEMSHIACPEVDHTELFKKIFKFFIIVAVQLNIYQNVNYQLDPVEYCGMVINENLVKNH
jgi:hypothetical protein